MEDNIDIEKYAQKLRMELHSMGLMGLPMAGDHQLFSGRTHRNRPHHRDGDLLLGGKPDHRIPVLLILKQNCKDRSSNDLLCFSIHA